MKCEKVVSLQIDLLAPGPLLPRFNDRIGRAQLLRGFCDRR